MVLGQSLLLFMGAIFLTLLAMDIFRTPVVSLMPDITPSPKRSQANGLINLMVIVYTQIEIFILNISLDHLLYVLIAGSFWPIYININHLL